MTEKSFRGKEIVSKEWVYGCLLSIGSLSWILTYDQDKHSLYSWQVDPRTVMQKLPRLSHRFVRDIYEGDIVNCTDRHGSRDPFPAMIYDENSIICLENTLGRWFPQDTLNYEVTGNIIDNYNSLNDKAKRYLEHYIGYVEYN